MKTINLTKGEYASKWGLSDFYPEAEEALKEAVAQPGDFDTGWFGAKKEIHYGRIVRENGKVLVNVRVEIDDLYDGEDLIYDALWAKCGVEVELPEHIIDSIRDAAIDCGIDDSAESSCELPGTASIDDIKDALNAATDEAKSATSEMYDRLGEIVSEHYKYLVSGMGDGNK